MKEEMKDLISDLTEIEENEENEELRYSGFYLKEILKQIIKLRMDTIKYFEAVLDLKD